MTDKKGEAKATDYSCRFLDANMGHELADDGRSEYETGMEYDCICPEEECPYPEIQCPAKPLVVQIERRDGSKFEGVFDPSVTNWLERRLKETNDREAGQDD